MTRANNWANCSTPSMSSSWANLQERRETSEQMPTWEYEKRQMHHQRQQCHDMIKNAIPYMSGICSAHVMHLTLDWKPSHAFDSEIKVTENTTRSLDKASQNLRWPLWDLPQRTNHHSSFSAHMTHATRELLITQWEIKCSETDFTMTVQRQWVQWDFKQTWAIWHEQLELCTLKHVWMAARTATRGTFQSACDYCFE